jgi:hypothetical protein
MMRAPIRGTLPVLVLLAIGGCALRGVDEQCPATAAGGPPVLLALRPDSVASALVLAERAEVTLVGCEFGTAAARVTMGPQAVDGVRPTDGGTRVVLPVPASISSGGEAAPMPTPAGTYDVVIITARGRSSARTLTVY